MLINITLSITKWLYRIALKVPSLVPQKLVFEVNELISVFYLFFYEKIVDHINFVNQLADPINHLNLRFDILRFLNHGFDILFAQFFWHNLFVLWVLGNIKVLLADACMALYWIPLVTRLLERFQDFLAPGGIIFANLVEVITLLG